MTIKLTKPWPPKIGGVDLPAGTVINNLNAQQERSLKLGGVAEDCDEDVGAVEIEQAEPEKHVQHQKPLESPVKKPAAAPGKPKPPVADPAKAPGDDEAERMAIRKDIIELGGEVPPLDADLATFKKAKAKATRDAKKG